MMGMRGSNWLGFLMLVILIPILEPIWLFVFSDSDGSANIVWAIPVAIYVLVGATLLIRGGPERDDT